MKKIFLSLTVVLMLAFMTSCGGMSESDISASLTTLDTAYQSGTYEQAQSEVDKLDKAYKKMTDEQKTKFDELKKNVEYAKNNAPAIMEGLNKAQSFYEQQDYYSAQGELERLSSTYTLPPAEKKLFDEKSSVVNGAINEWQVTEKLQNAQNFYNSKNYDAANNELAAIDMSKLSTAQSQTYTMLKENIDKGIRENADFDKLKAYSGRWRDDLGFVNDWGYDYLYELTVKVDNAHTDYVTLYMKAPGESMGFELNSKATVKKEGDDIVLVTDGYVNEPEGLGKHSAKYRFKLKDNLITMTVQYDGETETRVFKKA